MNTLIIAVCFFIGFFICYPFYRKMLSVAKDMKAEFSTDAEGRKGFNNGVHGNFFMGQVYVLMLPIFLNLLITFALYLLVQKLS